MTAYYNEIEPYAAAWLKTLIREGHIADGEVDTRSIVDVDADDLDGFTQCHFFAGLGGWSGALRLAGWPDDRPVWTGSCPCQPFSLAGKQKGFADERHLWPVWRTLVSQRRPAKVYGEQVASAAEWLRLVRSDLEALDYAVGAIPIEAASAGADHLRDRFWFMADSHYARSQGRELLPERADQRPPRQDGVAYANGDASSTGRGDASEVCSVPETQRKPEHRAPLSGGSRREIDVGDAVSAGAGWDRRDGSGSQTQGGGEWRVDGGVGDAPIASGGELSWIIGADGKARRVKPGIRLLAHGVPARVAKLRALGNAIDLRPAAAFIRATM